MTNERLKTRDVANELGVSPSTVLNWVKKYDIPYELNQHGHYQFTQEQLVQFREIHKKRGEREEPVSSQYVEERLAKMEEKIKILESMIGNKADDIVTFQLVEHRKTVREIESRLKKIEAHMKQWEKRQLKEVQEPPKEKPFLANLFSL